MTREVSRKRSQTVASSCSAVAEGIRWGEQEGEKENPLLRARCASTPKSRLSAAQASVRSDLKAATLTMDQGWAGAGGFLLALPQGCCDYLEGVVGVTQLFAQLKYLVLFLEHP